MLLFAASMDGQGAVAIQAARDYEKLTGNNIYTALTLVRFGRFDDIAMLSDRSGNDVRKGMWDFAKGYAALRNGDSDEAKDFAEAILETSTTSSAAFQLHSAEHLLGDVGNILLGEVLREEGDLAGAIVAFEAAVALEDQLIYDEPEPLPFAARDWLGAALLENEDFAGAEEVYRAALEDHPHNGWSLYGLLKALEGQDKTDAGVQADFDQSWARSDTWIRRSRF
jgi:tetratricopeptide (TPR) repeat protein